jgi:ADP-ribose pyrophosphatase
MPIHSFRKKKFEFNKLAKLKRQRVLYTGKIFTLAQIEKPSRSKKGKTRRWDVIRHPGASVILPILSQNRVVLIRQNRPAVGQTIWELPAGTLEKGESPRSCAHRELIEETGYRARSLKRLVRFLPSPGFCDEKMHVFIARDLEYVGQCLEQDEELKVHVLPVKRVLKMIQQGLIQDAKTLIAISLWQTQVRT